MEEITLFINTRSFKYKKGSKVLQIPFIKNLLHFENDKHEHTIHFPNQFETAWQNYTDVVEGKRDFKYPFMSGFDRPNGKKPIIPNPVYAEMAEYMTDEIRILKLVPYFPSFFRCETLISCMNNIHIKTKYREAIYIEIYKKNKEEAMVHFISKTEIFDTLCKYEIQLIQKQYQSPQRDEIFPNLPKLIFDRDINLEHYPLVKCLIEYIDSCETILDFELNKTPVAEFVSNNLLVLHLDDCVCGFFKEVRCTCRVHHFKYKEGKRYIIGTGSSTYGNEVGVHLSPEFESVKKQSVKAILIDYYEGPISLKIYPWTVI